MCFKMPKPKKPPAPPNKLDTANDALRAMAARRAGGITRSDTNVTGGIGGTPNVTTVSGGKPILGG